MAEAAGPSAAAPELKEGEMKVIASDGTIFVHRRDMLKKFCQVFFNVIEEFPDATEVQAQNVTGPILAKVLEYMKAHGETHGDVPGAKRKRSEDELKKFDADFVKVDQATLFELMMAANYLDSKELLDLTCLTAANMIKGKTPEEIFKTFNVPKLTPEEENACRVENPWAYD